MSLACQVTNISRTIIKFLDSCCTVVSKAAFYSSYYCHYDRNLLVIIIIVGLMHDRL